MTWEQAVQVGILLIGFVSFMYPLHQANRRASQANRELLQTAAIKLQKVWRKLKQHDRRTRKTRQLAENVLQRLARLEADNLKQKDQP